MRTSEKQVKPIEIDDINIIENEKNQKAITAAAWVMQLNGLISAFMVMWHTFSVKYFSQMLHQACK